MEEEKRISAVTTAKCANCGSQMVFDAKLQALHCEACGSDVAVAVGSDQVVEHAFAEALNLSAAETGFGTERRSFACKTCGAVTSVAATEVALKCSFCASENVNEEAFNERVIRPFGVLPFRIVGKDASAAFKGWIGTGWFHPNDLKKFAELNRLDGVYVPFWTYDAVTASEWTAESGYYYYETEYYTDDDGNQQSREVQRTRWEYSSGYYNHAFDDVTVVASGGIKQHMIEKIYPYPLAEVVNYDANFLLGWKAEVYALDVKQGYAEAEEIMDNFIRREVSGQVPGDTFRDLVIRTQKDEVTYKHLLLPVWIAAYRYHQKAYQVVVNGITGKIAGEKPISAFKVALAVIFGLIIVAMLILLYQKIKH